MSASSTSARPLSALVAVALLAVVSVVLVSGCASAEPASGASTVETTSVETTSVETTSVEARRDERAPADAGPAPGESELDGVTGPTVDVPAVELSDTDLTRVAFAGITLVYPSGRFAAVDSPATGDPFTVTVDFASEGGQPGGSIVVRTVRDLSGAVVDQLAAPDRETIDRVESGLGNGAPLSFVNGVGGRRVDADRYLFEGMTDAGAHLVRVDLVVPFGDDGLVAELDRMVESIFVDTSSPVLSINCRWDVEIMSEAELWPGPVVAPGAIVTASWTIRNTGSCAWAESDVWVFTGGTPVELLDPANVGGVAPGAEHRVTVKVRAPLEPGSYSAQWQLQIGAEMMPLDPIQIVQFDVVVD